MTHYNETPQTLDELHESLSTYHKLLKDWRAELAAYIDAGGNADDEDAPVKPMGPVMTGDAMLEIVGIVLSLREWFNNKTKWGTSMGDLS